MAEVIRAFGEPHNLDHRPLALRGLSDLEFNELGGTDPLWEALNSYILLFLEGVSRADIVPATDAPLPIIWATRFIDGVERASSGYRLRP